MKARSMVLLAAVVAVLGFVWSVSAPPVGAQPAGNPTTVFALGDAGYYGSTAGIASVHPLVGMAATPSGHGYWLVASDGGVFAFGDARFYGSMGGTPLTGPVTGIAATPTGNGYWLAGRDGGVFSFGSAGFFGSATGLPASHQVVGIEATPTGGGYWLVASATPVVTPPGPTAGVNVYLSRTGVADCSAVYPVARAVTPPQVLAGAISALLAGPTSAEKASGYTSFFSSATAGMLNWAHVGTNGVARIDFANFSSIIPNASTSCGSQMLLSALNHTATQFASVRSAVYSFDGNVAAFYNWLQLAAPPAPAS